MICSDLNVMLILLSLEFINKTNNKKMSADAADNDDGMLYMKYRKLKWIAICSKDLCIKRKKN